MRKKRVYDAPLSRAVPFQPEGNFCQSYPSVSVIFGGGDDGGSGSGGGGNGGFDDEIDW